MDELDVSIVSYNINGTKDEDDSIDYLLSINDIVCLQEHLLCSSSFNFLLALLPLMVLLA